MTERRETLAHLRSGILVDRGVLPLDRPAGAGVQAGVALGDESLDARRPAGREQVVGALGAQPVGERELAFEVPHVDLRGYGGELVHDHVGLRLAHDPAHGVGIERVGHHGLRAEAAQLVSLGFRAGHPHDIVPVGDQQGNELLAERTGGPGDEYLHGDSLLVRTP